MKQLFKTSIWSIVAIALAVFCLWLFPSPAFDACFPNPNGQYGCGVWPDILAGFTFVLICFFGGPVNKWHYGIASLLFVFLGSAEVIRFGGFSEVLLYAPYQKFYYGGIVAFAAYLGFRRLRYNQQCT
ncbi:MAG: hypothetical protein VX781_07270 [Pseudomonadota bacterium]|nr:hypothetical protein [Pseudomonadota bacterium]